eukprot:TRINITY_DN5256_c0_g1_i1.p2 TRINITY_DN5256_c0_g1~~TRINITY_DN5256_c0_g1_i1.p2  ORF type:complete len:104 (-),score=24.16 TRINITY_DN5256_c0_g1_i1:134-445(-)
MRFIQILAIVAVCLVAVQSKPQLLRQLMNLLGGKVNSMTNRLVVEQENNINREFSARNVEISPAIPYPVSQNSRGKPSPNCVCRCDCCPCCPCGDEEYQYVDT